MKVLIFNQQDDVPINESQVDLIAKEVLANENFKTDELSLYFVTTAQICQLHEDFFNDPSPTDCITFPMDEPNQETDYHILGEVFVCPQTALEYVRGQKNEGDVGTEITLYIVHGLLHLMGYDDIAPPERKKMRAAEKRHMNALFNKKLLLNTH